MCSTLCSALVKKKPKLESLTCTKLSISKESWLANTLEAIMLWDTLR